MTVEIVRRTVTQQSELSESLHPVLRRIYAARQIKSEADIDYSLTNLLPFHELKNIESAVELLMRAIDNRSRVLIVADFDADGATSCALAIRGLSMMGLNDVLYVVPNRFEFGYGLTPEIIDVAMEFDPDLLITVDNGISSIKGVNYAKQQGLSVMITDHHLPAAELPDADVIINPQLSGDKFPSKNLAGVGVMFYVLLALRAGLKAINWFDKTNTPYPNLARLLDLVALGTVADVVPLDKNNRILVAHGLKLIRQRKCIPGILALLKQSGKSVETIQSSDLGFSVAPRLNAAGRLTDMSLGIECLLSEDISAATDIAKQLDELNKERKQIQDQMQAQALLTLEQNLPLEKEENSNGYCLYHPQWHQGVIGILAAKVKEKFNRPVIAFADDGDAQLKGSARSITNLHIRDLLELMTTRFPELIISFGGHAMAAGLTIARSDFEKFKHCFHEVLAETISDDMLQGHVLSDGELLENEMSMELAEIIQSAGPWGQSFPEPVFDGEFEILARRIVGGNHLKLKLQASDGNEGVDAIAFNMTDADWPVDTTHVRAAYRLDINEYQSRRSLQLMIHHLQLL